MHPTRLLAGRPILATAFTQAGLSTPRAPQPLDWFRSHCACLKNSPLSHSDRTWILVEGGSGKGRHCHPPFLTRRLASKSGHPTQTPPQTQSTPLPASSRSLSGLSWLTRVGHWRSPCKSMVLCWAKSSTASWRRAPHVSQESTRQRTATQTSH
jgi:hypothetical protein